MLGSCGQMGEFLSPFATIVPWVHSVEHGIIYGWTGSLLNIPPHFMICDGSNDTPDLRDRFVIGALDTYGIGERNGVSVHVHSFTSDTHHHSRSGGLDFILGPQRDETLDLRTDSGTTDPADLTPPFYALCYLMKL